jgi:DNA polymerase-3 subunit alpha
MSRSKSLPGTRKGLIALTGGAEGAMARLIAEGQDYAAIGYADRLLQLFPALIELAYARNLPLVATNPASFAEPGFHDAHDAMLCIANSTHVDAPDRPRSSRDGLGQVRADDGRASPTCPRRLANTLIIAQRCAYAPPKRKPILPSLAGDKEGEAQMLADDARAGLERRLAPYGEMEAARGAAGLFRSARFRDSTSSTRWALPATS